MDFFTILLIVLSLIFGYMQIEGSIIFSDFPVWAGILAGIISAVVFFWAVIGITNLTNWLFNLM